YASMREVEISRTGKSTFWDSALADIQALTELPENWDALEQSDQVYNYVRIPEGTTAEQLAEERKISVAKAASWIKRGYAPKIVSIPANMTVQEVMELTGYTKSGALAAMEKGHFTPGRGGTNFTPASTQAFENW